MPYRNASDFRDALGAHLRHSADELGLPIQRLRKRVVFECFLARLTIAAKGRWILKGGVALEFRLDAKARSTQDLDLARNDSDADAWNDLQAAARVQMDDWFTFVVERSQKARRVVDGVSRYTIDAHLGARTFEKIRVEIGFGDPITWKPHLLSVRRQLEFSGLAPVEIPTLPLELHIAQKVHAYTRRYGAEQLASARPKDLVDLILISTGYDFEAGHLRAALTETFAHRATHDLPANLPKPPTDWRMAYRLLASEVGVSPDLELSHSMAAAFLDPILSNIATDPMKWDHRTRVWR